MNNSPVFLFDLPFAHFVPFPCHFVEFVIPKQFETSWTVKRSNGVGLGHKVLAYFVQVLKLDYFLSMFREFS